MRGRLVVALAAAGLAWAAISPGAEAFAPGSITVGGQDIPIAANGYVGDGHGDDGFAYRAQSVIDTGAVASGVTPLNVSDGANTHLMAHNPGTFSAIANTIHEGAKYVITDFNGVSKVYEFHFVAEIQAYTPVNGALDSAIWGQNGETITLQYCAYGTGTPQIWIGYPSEDQSLLSVTPTAEGALTQTEDSTSVAKTEEGESQADDEAEVQAEVTIQSDPEPEVKPEPVVIAGEVDGAIKWGQPITAFARTHCSDAFGALLSFLSGVSSAGSGCLSCVPHMRRALRGVTGA